MRNKSKLKRLYMNPTSPCSLAHLHSLTLVSSICSPPEQHRGTRNRSYIWFITHCLCSSFLTLFSWPRVGSVWHGLFPQAAVLQGKSICLSVGSLIHYWADVCSDVIIHGLQGNKLGLFMIRVESVVPRVPLLPPSSLTSVSQGLFFSFFSHLFFPATHPHTAICSLLPSGMGDRIGTLKRKKTCGLR